MAVSIKYFHQVMLQLFDAPISCQNSLTFSLRALTYSLHVFRVLWSIRYSFRPPLFRWFEPVGSWLHSLQLLTFAQTLQCFIPGRVLTYRSLVHRVFAEVLFCNSQSPVRCIFLSVDWCNLLRLWQISE